MLYFVKKFTVTTWGNYLLLCVVRYLFLVIFIVVVVVWDEVKSSTVTTRIGVPQGHIDRRDM